MSTDGKGVSIFFFEEEDEFFGDNLVERLFVNLIFLGLFGVEVGSMRVVLDRVVIIVDDWGF